MSLKFGKTPCHCKEYTLAVTEYSLTDGTATLVVYKDGAPFKKNVVGVSFCIVPPTPSVAVLVDKCCKQYVTDCDGKINVTFDANPLNQVRVNVNINLGGCGTDCCIRLTKCLSPQTQMDVCPLSYLSMDEHQSCGGCCGNSK